MHPIKKSELRGTLERERRKLNVFELLFEDDDDDGGDATEGKMKMLRKV